MLVGCWTLEKVRHGVIPPLSIRQVLRGTKQPSDDHELFVCLTPTLPPNSAQNMGQSTKCTSSRVHKKTWGNVIRG